MSFLPSRLPHSPTTGSKLRDYILGGQDGLVNVLGLVLGIAIATNETKIILIGGLTATFAELIAMAAVAYTSSRAVRDFYYRELEREKREIIQMPDEKRKKIRQIYRGKGFRGEELELIVRKITSDKNIWLESMMTEGLRLFPKGYERPVINGVRVGVSSFLGSLVPLIPFAFLAVQSAIVSSVIVTLIALFIIGSIKAKLTIGNWITSGIEMGFIGLAAAVAGYLIGVLLGNL